MGSGIKPDQLDLTLPYVFEATTDDPLTGSGKGSFYVKRIAGVVEGYFRDELGNVTKITNRGAAVGGGGSVWYDGSGVPVVGLGEDGDYYLDGVTGNVYKKVTGTWGVVANIKGADGAVGANGVDGTNGIDGIDGAQGIPGIDGAPGADGAQGIPGIDGAPGADGVDGIDGIDGLGVPAGGTVNQVLTKVSGIDNDTNWADPTGGLTFGEEFLLILPAGADLATRIAGATKPAAWTLQRGDEVSGQPFDTTNKTLIITHGDSNKVPVHARVYQKNDGPLPALDYIQQVMPSITTPAANYADFYRSNLVGEMLQIKNLQQDTDSTKELLIFVKLFSF